MPRQPQPCIRDPALTEVGPAGEKPENCLLHKVVVGITRVMEARQQVVTIYNGHEVEAGLFSTRTLPPPLELSGKIKTPELFIQ